MRGLAFSFIVLLSCVHPAAQRVPALTGRVVDRAEILSAQSEISITSILEKHEEGTSNQVVVLTIPSLEGSSIEAYANLVFREWGLGRADANNGVLLLVSKDDRELRIEVGYGLESDLTDAAAGKIIRNVIVPLFRNGDFEGGIIAGVSAIVGTIDGSFTPPDDGGGGEDDFPWWVVLLFTCTHGILPLLFGVRSLVNPPVSRYLTFVFTLMFIVPISFLLGGGIGGEPGFRAAAVILSLYVLLYVALDIHMSRSPKWQDIRKKVRAAQKKGKSTRIDAGWISFSAGGSSSSGGGGGFSGGGGSSGGGGASGSW